MKNKIFLVTMVLLATFIALSFVSPDQPNDPWPVPDKYKKMENPEKFDKKLATSLWVKHCKSCHGSEGLGDGTKAAQLDTKPGDFTTSDFQKQPDGALFYKTTEGRDDMPSFKKKIPDAEDIWQLVHLMRTFE